MRYLKIIILCLLFTLPDALAVKTQKIIMSFNAGELSPLMDSRLDQAKYVAGCRTLENFIPLIYGGAQRRPGTEYIAGQKSNSAKGRLIAFEHSVDDTYILLFENQVIRVFTDGATVFGVFTTEDLSAHTSNIKAQWKMNDNTNSSVVIDADGATHNGALYDSTNTTGGATQETRDVSTANDAGTANKAFDMSLLTGGSGAVLVSDNADFSFGNGSSDNAFTLLAVVNYTSDGTRQDIITKWKNDNREWALYIDTDDKIVLKLFDESVEEATFIKSGNTVTGSEWTFIAVTYNGEGGSTAANGISLYVNWRLVEVTTTNNSNYVAMESLGADVMLGGKNGVAQILIVQDEGLDTTITAAPDMSQLDAAFDGNKNQTSGNGAFVGGPGANGPVYIGKDWGENNARIVTGFKIWGSNDQGFVNVDNPTVTATLQGSQNNSDWTDLGNASATDETQLKLENLAVTATTAYRYHRMKITHDSGVNRAMYATEVEFYQTGGSTWTTKLDNIAVLDIALTADEIAALISTSSTDALEITSPYLTADLFQLKFEQSADVMFITHPSYEPRRLSRLSDTSWTLAANVLETGPFRDRNTDTAKTITASGTTGTITLTAVGHSPFRSGITAGHEPSGAGSTSKSQTGALFKLVHSSATPSIVQNLNSTTLNDATSTLSVKKGVTWDFVTNGTWGSGSPSAVVLERSYDNGSNYETVHTVVSLANKNIITSGTEDVADALYRVRVSDGSGTGTVNVHISIRDTAVVGIVKITAVASTTSATATVLATLASTDSTHRWSEGSFSNYRGWPIDVKISSEERLTFAGNIAEPLTTWGSTKADWTDFAEGTLADDAIQFTLIGSGQQNRIRWLVSKSSLFLGTVGGEHILGASKVDEALTPTNARARLQTTYGSEDIAALIVNQAILFVQRGGKKIREFLYNFDADAHKADDLTVFSEHITGDGIVNMAYQRTPDPTLWCIRTDGQIAIMTYERDQKVFSWSRIVTRDGDEFESIAIIYGGVRSEDEVWVTVKRDVNGGDVRYVERFFQRAMPDSLSDMKFLDSYITDTGGDTTVEVAHLIGETVQVLGDGLVQATKTVSGGGTITAATTATKYQVGLGYTSTLKPMKLDIAGMGLATTKRINKAIVNVFETIGGQVGPSTDALEDIPTGVGALFTGHKEISMPGGYSREGDIIIQQTDPLPMTALSLTLEVGIGSD